MLLKCLFVDWAPIVLRSNFVPVVVWRRPPSMSSTWRSPGRTRRKSPRRSNRPRRWRRTSNWPRESYCDAEWGRGWMRPPRWGWWTTSSGATTDKKALQSESLMINIKLNNRHLNEVDISLYLPTCLCVWTYVKYAGGDSRTPSSRRSINQSITKINLEKPNWRQDGSFS